MSVLQQFSTRRNSALAISERLNEPQWLREKRLAAFDLFEKMDLPSRFTEEWKRTDLSALELDGLVTFHGGGFDPSLEQLRSEVAGGEAAEQPNLILQHNSLVVKRQLQEDLARKGVIFTDIATAAREYPDLVQKYLGTVVRADETRFTAMHMAFMSGGTFVYVPKNVEVEVPLRAAVLANTPRGGMFNHTLVVADAGSSVHYTEWYASPNGDEEQSFHSGAVEVVALEGSRVTFGYVQNWGDYTYSFTTRRAQVGRDAWVEIVAGDFGGFLTRSEVKAETIGEGAGSNIYQVFFAGGDQTLDIHVTQQQTAPHSEGDIQCRGVLTDRGRALYRGTGFIPHGGRGSKTFQKAMALNLSDKSRAEALPILIIEETNVLQAGHAATVGQVDKNLLFYLQSRGLSKAQALRLMVRGFMAPVMTRLPEGMQANLQWLIDRKLGV